MRVYLVGHAISPRRDPEARNRMALAAWRFAQEERWDRRAQRMLALYEEVLRDADRPF